MRRINFGWFFRIKTRLLRKKKSKITKDKKQKLTEFDKKKGEIWAEIERELWVFGYQPFFMEIDRLRKLRNNLNEYRSNLIGLLKIKPPKEQQEIGLRLRKIGETVQEIEDVLAKRDLEKGGRQD